MKNKIVAGNWKMNKTFPEAEELLVAIAEGLDDMELETDVIICPPYPYLEMAADVSEESNFTVGAQNVSYAEKGAYTGEVSAAMLKSAGVDTCIVGHSERRAYFKETDEELAKKVDLLLANDLVPIFCVGETLEEREKGTHWDKIGNQLKNSLFHLNKEDISKVIVAYEPVWAIGTGKTATPQQAQEVHAFIRRKLEEKYGTETAYNIYILYGGSCNPKNALELFSCPDVDGGLIGGASLNAEDFIAIVNAAETCTKND
ncbi:MAG: triose-phosphate isomerase [Bacteroidales bacterium]|jgi:triosephosphate isomerase|nr:triose-phosphate isomerase [Bacteroidales bacterium]MBQ2490049.1 triose-phosphate isomerase [Bacteroidales bacterium]